MTRSLALTFALALLVAGCAGSSPGPPSERSSVFGSAVPPGVVSRDIVGGQAAPEGRWPYAAFLRVGLDRNGDGRADARAACGGSLIGARWVLTAAHCLPDALSVEVWIGEEARPDTHPELRYVASATEGDIWSHPSFDPLTMKNDVALVRLDRPAPDPKVVFVLSDDDRLWRTGVDAAIVGWGLTAEGGDVSEELREARVPIVSDDECARAYPATRRRSFDPDSMFCAGFPEGGVDACQGDSGGPILAPVGTLWAVAGVVSWGAGCARPGKPGVYSRLETLSDAVLSRLEGDSEAPVSAPQLGSAEAATTEGGSTTIEARVQTRGLGAIAVLEVRPAGSDDPWSVTRMRDVGTDEPETVSFGTDGLEPGRSYEYRVSLASSTGHVAGAVGTLEIPS